MFVPDKEYCLAGLLGQKAFSAWRVNAVLMHSCLGSRSTYWRCPWTN